jgi:molybdenum cofactor biosynthesis enzyme MoaA
MKVNVVLVPGVNEEHIGAVAEATAAAGASLINVIPLIPAHQLSNLPAPDFIQVHDARAAAEKHLLYRVRGRESSNCCVFGANHNYLDRHTGIFATL